MIIKYAIVLVVLLAVAAFVSWAFLPARYLPSNRARYLRLRALEVPLTADSVAPPRLVYGGLGLASDTDGDDGYAALYFPVADSGALGRVTFEGLDAFRAARGEMLPYDLTAPQALGDWVFTVDGSPWLAERHHYEMQLYSTPLLDTHQHYAFWFHDQFAEAIAEGIWLDIADPARRPAGPASAG